MRRQVLALSAAAMALAAVGACGERNVEDGEFPPGYWERDAQVPADAGVADAAVPLLWKDVAAPVAAPFALNAIHGVAGPPSVALAVGEGGAVFRLDGSTWSVVPNSLTTAALNAVWFADAGEAWIAGAAGTVLRWTASAGLEDRSVAGAPDFAAVLARDGAVWAGGKGGAMWRYQGGAWTDASLSSKADVTGMWGDAASAWAVTAAGEVLRLDASGGWSKVVELAPLRGVVGVASRVVWLAGDGVATELDDTEGTARLTAHPTPGQAATLSYRAIWGDARDNLWIGAHRKALLRWTGSVWDTVPDFDAAAAAPLIRGMWGAAPADVWAVGADTLLHLGP